MLDADEVDRLSLAIQPLLKGRHPAVQGAVLADLMAIWLASHREDQRAALTLAHWRSVDKLTAVYADLFQPEATRQ